jgi:hypothetical protein
VASSQRGARASDRSGVGATSVIGRIARPQPQHPDLALGPQAGMEDNVPVCNIDAKVSL